MIKVKIVKVILMRNTSLIASKPIRYSSNVIKPPTNVSSTIANICENWKFVGQTFETFLTASRIPTSSKSEYIKMSSSVTVLVRKFNIMHHSV